MQARRLLKHNLLTDKEIHHSLKIRLKIRFLESQLFVSPIMQEMMPFPKNLPRSSFLIRQAKDNIKFLHKTTFLPRKIATFAN